MSPHSVAYWKPASDGLVPGQARGLSPLATAGECRIKANPGHLRADGPISSGGLQAGGRPRGSHQRHPHSGLQPGWQDPHLGKLGQGCTPLKRVTLPVSPAPKSSKEVPCNSPREVRRVKTLLRPGIVWRALDPLARRVAAFPLFPSIPVALDGPHQQRRLPYPCGPASVEEVQPT